MVDNLQAGSKVNDFVIWHDGNDNGLLQKIKITGDIISHWEYDANRVVQIHAEVQNDSHTHKFANITEKPTTLDGYGITDGVQEGDSVTLTGDVVGTGVFDSNGNVSINTTVPLSSHDHDDMYYTKAEIDTKQSQYWTSSQVEAAITVSSPIGLRGQLTYINKDGTRNTELDWLIKEGKFVDTPEDLASALSSSISNEEVFNEWGRFSHNSTENQPANSSEINNWEYNASDDTISCTINSATHIGFYSNKKIEKYTIDLQLSSTVADDDMMGVVIAFAVDDNGREHTLTAIRTNNNWVTYNWLIIYNYLRSDQWIVAYSTSIIDGSNWNNYSIGTRIKVNRDGDSITAISTQNNSADFVPESELNIDLTSDPRLAIFRGPQSYGYSCHSQDNSTFSDIKFTEYGSNASDNYVFDIPNNDIYIPDGNGGYTLDTTKTLDSEIGPGKLIRDIVSKKTWYLSPTGEVESIINGIDFLPLSGGTISGDLTVINNLTAGTITETSARKYKENITTIDNSLEILRKLNGVSYQWKDTKVRDIGFIADDVVEVLPELISFKDGEIQGMNYSKLTAVLVNGINDLAQTVKELNAKVDTLQKIIQDKGDR